MLQTINERIKAILDTYYKGNTTAMAKATYIKRTTLNSITGADEVSPRYEVLKNIAELSSPKISMEWLIRGVGDMELSEESKPVEIKKNSDNRNTSINDGDTINRLLALLEEKDKQITKLIDKINN